MPDDRAWSWYCGVLAGWGDCIWQAADYDRDAAFSILRYVVKIVATPRGEGVVKVPFGAEKGADVTIRADKIITVAQADEGASDTAMQAYGLKTLVSATAADLDKAPRLKLV